MIVGITGLPGNGKTLLGVLLLCKAARSGRDTYANFHSRFGDWRYTLWDGIKNLDNAMVVIDEAHMWLGARNWRDNDISDLALFQQHRKDGLDLFWIAQHEARVDTAIREVTAYYWRVKRLGNFLLVRVVSPDEPREVIGKKLFFCPPSYFRRYHTHEAIGRRDGTGSRLGAARSYASAGEYVFGDVTHVRLSWPGGYEQIVGVGDVETIKNCLCAHGAVGAVLSDDLIALRRRAEQLDDRTYNLVHHIEPLYRDPDGRFHEIKDL